MSTMKIYQPKVKTVQVKYW